MMNLMIGRRNFANLWQLIWNYNKYPSPDQYLLLDEQFFHFSNEGRLRDGDSFSVIFESETSIKWNTP